MTAEESALPRDDAPLADTLTALQQARALTALQQAGHQPVPMTLPVPQLFLLVMAVQTALRHPHFPASSRAFLEPWLEATITAVGTVAPDVEPLLRAGNDPVEAKGVGNREIGSRDEGQPSDPPSLPPYPPFPSPRPGPAPSLEIVLQPTDQLVQLDGVLCRVWQGVTDAGLPCLFFVHRIRGAQGQDSAAFDAAVQVQLPPGRVVALNTVL